MQVWVVQKILTPGMEDGKEADLRTQMLGGGGDRSQRLGDRAEENAVDGLFGVVQKWPVLGNTDNKNPAARQGWF
jgi:hypothetical protein